MDFARAGRSAPAARFGLIPEPVEEGTAIDRDEARRRLAIPSGGRYVAMVGTLEPRKGIEELLAAFELSPLPLMSDMPVFFEVAAYLDERGYKLYDIAGHIRRPSDNSFAQIDLAFVRKGGILDKNEGW